MVIWLRALNLGFLWLITRAFPRMIGIKERNPPHVSSQWGSLWRGVSSFGGIFLCTYAGIYVTRCSTGRVCGNIAEMKACWNVGHFKHVPCENHLHGLLYISLNLEKIMNRSCLYAQLPLSDMLPKCRELF